VEPTGNSEPKPSGFQTFNEFPRQHSEATQVVVHRRGLWVETNNLLVRDYNASVVQYPSRAIE
jgi:hypothetical protein